MLDTIIKFAGGARELFANGLNDTHLLADLGAGMCDFDFYLRCVRGWKGRYLPVDLSIDGTDLEEGWMPRLPVDYCVAMELIEHLNHSPVLLNDMVENTRELVVVTTPNATVYGDQWVIDMDRTHVRPWHIHELIEYGYTAHQSTFFGQHNDSVIGTAKGEAK